MFGDFDGVGRAFSFAACGSFLKRVHRCGYLVFGEVALGIDWRLGRLLERASALAAASSETRNTELRLLRP